MKKLDLSPNERTWDSWGYLLNEGGKFRIYTYKAVTQEDLKIIQKIVFKIDSEKRELMRLQEEKEKEKDG